MRSTEARSILHLPPSFSAHDLKRAYRRAAAVNHPDRGGSTERMVAVNEAYGVLSAWTSAGEAATFYRETGHQAEPGHPADRYIRLVSIVLAAVWWITGIFDLLDEPRRLRPWILIGFPFAYLIVWVLARCVVRVGIHVYNFGIWLRDRIAPTGSWQFRA